MNKRLRILSIIVMSYMLAALCWWAVLLHRKNMEVFKLESKLLQEKFLNDANIPSVDVTTLGEYEDLRAKFNRQWMMIVGEAIVFGLVLIIGIYFINRAFNSELAIAQKQKNFLLSITHELKSPLASISLIMDTLIKRELPSEKVKELSSDALQESTRLNDLFDKILLATRLDSPQKLYKQDIDLSELVESVTYKFSKLNPTVDISKSIEKGHLKNLDSEAMISVLTNILENSVKYTTQAARIIVRLDKKGNKSQIAISDNGIGIPAGERSKVLDQFYRVGSEETRISKGTGLGLYIVNQLITRQGGRVDIEDSEIGGTKIKILI